MPLLSLIRARPAAARLDDADEAALLRRVADGERAATTAASTASWPG
jgi:RNA polymerase sigma-70 factor (ECF subfamily)